MNKYLKRALEEKLDDNNIKIGDKFKVEGFTGEYCVYDGETVYKCVYSVTNEDNIISMPIIINSVNTHILLNNKFEKVSPYEKISFEHAYKMLSESKDVYVKDCGGDMVKLSIVERELEFQRVTQNLDILDNLRSCLVNKLTYEFINSVPSKGRITFKNLHEYQFYDKVY